MTASATLRRGCWLATGIALVMAHAVEAAGPAAAGSSSADAFAPSDVKAAFILNFVAFTEWPVELQGAVRVCVVGDDNVTKALTEAVRARPSDGRRIIVQSAVADATVHLCGVVFISGDPPQRVTAMLESAAGASLLTVSDAPRFAQSGGMIELFIDQGRMRFAVNVDAVQRARLKLSSRVLGLAKIVRDTHVP